VQPAAARAATAPSRTHRMPPPGPSYFLMKNSGVE